MFEDIITGLIYIEYDEEFGPNPIHFTSGLEDDIILEVGKNITNLLLDRPEGGKKIVPDFLIFMAFPKQELKTLVKFVEFEKNWSAIILVFKEAHDAIFYKCYNDLEPIFKKLSSTFTSLKPKESDTSSIVAEFEKFNKTITALIEKIRNEEARKKEEYDPEEECDYVFKVIIVGDMGVGKTSAVLRFTDNAFSRNYLPTVGVNISKKVVKVKDKLIRLVLWDIAGQAKFELTRKQFYQGAEGIFLVFDLTRQPSFESISGWYEDVKQNNQLDDDNVGFILGNKSDLTKEIMVTEEDANQLANKLGLKHIKTSALTGENINESFLQIAESLLESRLNDPEKTFFKL